MIILDTNVVISSMLFPGSKELEVVVYALEHGLLIASNDIIEELMEVSTRKKFDKYLSSVSRVRFITNMLRDTTVLYPKNTMQLCRDPKDDKFLHLALELESGFLITGDEDLLSFGKIGNVTIMTASDFLLSHNS